MNKQQYLESLEKQLRARRVSETKEILAEYEEHFACKLHDGYSEEEIAARLEKPETLANQFKAAGQPAGNPVKAILTKTGLIALDMPVGLTGILLYAFILALAIVTVSFLGLAASLAVGKALTFGIIPVLPLWGRLFTVVSMLSFASLTAAGCVYYTLYIVQITRAYAHWHEGIFHDRKRPGLPLYPQMGNALRRGLRRLTLLSVLVAVVSLAAAYIALALRAGGFQFWHIFNWFV